MDSIYRLEMKKRRSKLTKEELIQRQETLINLQSEILELKEMQRLIIIIIIIILIIINITIQIYL